MTISEMPGLDDVGKTNSKEGRKENGLKVLDYCSSVKGKIYSRLTPNRSIFKNIRHIRASGKKCIGGIEFF